MHNKNITIKYLIFSIFILSVFTFGTKVLAVWDYPQNGGPGDGIQVLGPLNINSKSQQKTGAFIVGGGFRSTSSVIFDDTISVRNSNYGAGKVLTSDAEGNATWQTAQGGGGGTTWGSITGTLANQVDLVSLLNSKAFINNPVFTGDPRATTQFPGNNETLIATTAFVDQEIGVLNGSTNGWTRTSGLVALNTATDNIQIGENTTIYKGGSAEVNRFISTPGTNNLFAGFTVGKLDLTGQGNTGAGSSSLPALTTGSYNTALGFESLFTNTTGSENTGAGYRALYNSNANRNTGVGVQVLNNNVSGENNTALGYQALFSTTTSNNTGAGYTAGGSILAGNVNSYNNTFVGNNADIITNASFNVTAIGNGANVSVSNTMIFGNSSVTGWGFATQPQEGSTFYAMRVGSLNNNNGSGALLTLNGAWTGISDLNKKTNIQNLNYGLKEVLRLRPVSFDWKDSNTHDIGFIAQEVKEVIPELVYGTEGDLSLAYSQIPVVLVNAIAENQKIIEEYKEKIKLYTEKIEELEKIKGIKNAQ